MFKKLFQRIKNLIASLVGEKAAWSGVVVVILEGVYGKKRFVFNNMITNAGDIFYAQRGANQTPTNAFSNLFLGSKAIPTVSKTSNFASMTLIAGTNKALTATFPKTNDTDPDNGHGAANTVTYKYVYGKADFNAPSITEGVIAIPTATGTNPVLCHFAFPSAFEKTANDTLTVFVNHQSIGQ